MKKFEGVEVTQGNTIGKGGGASLPFGRGYYQSGNNGDFGTDFTPHGEETLKTYKNSKHSKKNLRRKMKTFSNFVKENLDTLDNTDVEILDVSFYDNDHKGFVIIKRNGRTKREHFRIYDYGNIGFDEFFSEENFEKLVKGVYEALPEGELKYQVHEYFNDLIEDIAITEDACATMGNSGGMGAVVSAQPSSTPGDVAGSTKGSGDIGNKPLGIYMKRPARWSNKKKKTKSFKNFSPIN